MSQVSVSAGPHFYKINTNFTLVQLICV